jgi:hypothetical protein
MSWAVTLIPLPPTAAVERISLSGTSRFIEWQMGRAPRRPCGYGIGAAGSWRTAAPVMLRAMPPKITLWNGAMDRQYR